MAWPTLAPGWVPPSQGPCPAPLSSAGAGKSQEGLWECSGGGQVVSQGLGTSRPLPYSPSEVPSLGIQMVASRGWGGQGSVRVHSGFPALQSEVS